MADNKTLPATGTGTANIVVATRTVTYSGDAADVLVVGIGAFAGSDDAKTVVDVPAGGGVEATALRVTIASDSTGVLSVDDNGGTLTVDANTTADTGNTTAATLGIGANFTGTGFDLTNYASWSISVFSNVASATNGLKIEWSENNSNWDFSDSSDYVASVGNMITFGRKARYVRVNYTNGVTGQTTFRVFAWGHSVFTRQTRKFLKAALTDADTAQVVVAAMQGHSSAGGGAWVDVKANPSGALVVDASGSVGGIGTATNIAAQVTVTNSSTAVVAARATRRAVTIVNNQTVAVYLDPTGGTAATTHFRLDPGASVTWPIVTAVTGITSAAYTASGDAKLHIFDAF